MSKREVTFLLQRWQKMDVRDILYKGQYTNELFQLIYEEILK